MNTILLLLKDLEKELLFENELKKICIKSNCKIYKDLKTFNILKKS
jgi:hypothetical protein